MSSLTLTVTPELRSYLDSYSLARTAYLNACDAAAEAHPLPGRITGCCCRPCRRHAETWAVLREAAADVAAALHALIGGAR